MSALELVQIAFYIALLTACTPLLGSFMAKVLNGQRNFMSPVLGPIENSIYKISGVDSETEMNWKTYTIAMLLFNLFGFLVVFLVQVMQGSLPLNPESLPNVPTALAFNTAASFTTNTNWQAYAGEVTLSYFSQMMALAVQNFVSAATGIAIVVVLIRGLARRSGQTIGNFWVDLVRSTLYILLPLSIILAVLLVSQGVVQTLDPYKEITTLTGEIQRIPLGPAA
jgi:K+-transporting ATPase ATPase A chain